MRIWKAWAPLYPASHMTDKHKPRPHTWTLQIGLLLLNRDFLFTISDQKKISSLNLIYSRLLKYVSISVYMSINHNKPIRYKRQETRVPVPLNNTGEIKTLWHALMVISVESTQIVITLITRTIIAPGAIFCKKMIS